MATTRTRRVGKRAARRAPARRRSSSSRRRGGGNKAIDRASASLDASQKALRELRDELAKSGSTLLKDAQLRDAEKLVKDAGISFRSLSKRLLKEVDTVATKARGRKTTKRKATKRKATKRRATSTAKRRPAAKKRATAKKRPAKKRTTAKKRRPAAKKRRR